MSKTKPTTITEYINTAPKEAQQKLHEIHSILKRAAPRATEGIKWGSPVFEEKRILFAFAAFKSHLNFMPTPSCDEAIQKGVGKVHDRQGSTQFPYDKPLPKALILKIAALRVKELREKDVRWM